jgi:HPt (histidine-containing phosphotransfer) domain-containing protein
MSKERQQPNLRSILANDPEIGELVDQFVGELPQKVNALLKAMSEGDAIRVRTLTHQLKGAAGGYGFPTIGQAAQRVEDCLRTEGSNSGVLEKVRSGVDELIGLCRQATQPSE